jgi:hypothetical protein
MNRGCHINLLSFSGLAIRGAMRASAVLRIFLTVIVSGLMALPSAQPFSHPDSLQVGSDKPPEVIRGGEWSDHFLTWQLSQKANTDLNASHLLLKLDENLHWTQTWTAHFAGGEFFKTEAISDSVRLAPNGTGHYFTTGVDTSTVLNAGKMVDWSSAAWTNSGTPDSLSVQYRTGITPTPDNTWTNWLSPRRVLWEYYCAFIINWGNTECSTNMNGIDSSQFIQYRAMFRSKDSATTIALYDTDLLYGTHPFTGTAISELISPVDLLAWENVIISPTIPTATTLVIDILATDGTILAQDVGNGDSLASINPDEHPALKLRAAFSTKDPSLTPDVDLWGLRWSVLTKRFSPIISR